MEEWGITGKVKCSVTDAAQNTIATATIMKVVHATSIAHALNLIVKKLIGATPDLDETRSWVGTIVTYIKTSTTVKEGLQQRQEQMSHQVMEMIEVETRWNSTCDMLQHFYEQRDALAAALATLNTHMVPLTARE